jgi:hypothetical protein
MAVTTLEYDVVTQAAAVCKKILTELEPALAQFREIYDAAGGVKETLTQEDLDAVASFSGLSKAQVDNALYALTALLLPAIESSTTALAQLAARDRGFAPPLPVMMMPPPVVA